ncbi:MAG: glycosyltransferase family 4 protein [Actinobacteria bacterium]|nr:glycosyltransferase family 4 protein [Actinomycetota bacterium]
MKVVLVCPYSLTLPGGVQVQVLGLAEAYRDLGVSATVLAPCDDEPPAAGVIPLGRSIPFASNGSVVPVAPDPVAVARTLSAVRAERPDVLHLHEPLSPGPCWAALLGGRAPAVGTFHASGGAVEGMYRFSRSVLRPLAKRLAIRTAVSDDARATAERWLGGAYRILPNAVDVERLAKAEPWPTDQTAILFVGRHEERKGLGVLLEAFAGLDLGATNGVVLWVAGEGPETDALRARHIPGVEWLGPISDDEKRRRLRAATLFCAPSIRGESFGIVLLEAMAAGVPVVASDIAGYRDVARRDREALLAPPENADALRGAIRRVLADAPLAARLVDAGRERAASFSMAALAERYVALFEQALARGPAKRGA